MDNETSAMDVEDDDDSAVIYNRYFVVVHSCEVGCKGLHDKEFDGVIGEKGKEWKAVLKGGVFGCRGYSVARGSITSRVEDVISLIGHRLGLHKVTYLEGVILTLAWDARSHPEVVVMCGCRQCFSIFC